MFAMSIFFSAEALVDSPTIALIDVSSSSYDAAKTRLLTHVLRSELFKAGIFRIKERGLVPKAMADQKGQVGWEHFWTSSLLSRYRLSTEAGLFLLNIIDPAPYIGLNFTFGSASFYGKLGVGEHADVLVGGSLASHVRLGFTILDQYEMTILAIPFGTQPKVSYVDLTTPMGDPG